MTVRETPRVTSPAAEQVKKTTWCNDIFSRYTFFEGDFISGHRGVVIAYAVDTKSGRRCVVKIRCKTKSFRGGGKTMWLENMEYLMNLSPSGHLAELVELLETEHCFYAVFEEIGGQDLHRHILESGGALPPSDVKHVLLQILIGLDQLHSESLIHKDIKLENVVMDIKPNVIDSPRHCPSPRILSPLKVKLIDFDTVEKADEILPRAKDVLGTDGYIAPEAYEGFYSHASDIFAAGALSYKLLTAEYPYPLSMFDDKPGENWVGSPQMRRIQERLYLFRVMFDQPVFRSEPMAKELIERMLATDQTMRPTAQEAMQHDWFRGLEDQRPLMKKRPPRAWAAA